MASTQIPVTFFLLISLSFIATNPSHSFSYSDTAKSPLPVRSKKVSMALYYETLCPSCRAFITEQLVKVFSTDLNSIVNLRLVPYGNAQVVGTKQTIICQHGEDECYLNSIHACAINIWPKTETHFKFVNCVEKEYERGGTYTSDHSPKAVATWKGCAQKLHLAIRSIEDCYDNGLAKKLILRYANDTDNLRPPHKFVPWVTVNDRPLWEGYENFVAEVCKAYKGDPPAACQSSLDLDSARMRQNYLPCYLGKARNRTPGLGG